MNGWRDSIRIYYIKQTPQQEEGTARLILLEACCVLALCNMDFIDYRIYRGDTCGDYIPYKLSLSKFGRGIDTFVPNMSFDLLQQSQSTVFVEQMHARESTVLILVEFNRVSIVNSTRRAYFCVSSNNSRMTIHP